MKPMQYVIRGGRTLSGEVEISGAKNAIVAILPAVLLCDEPCIIENVPAISDVTISLQILTELGAIVEKIDSRTYRIDPRPVQGWTVPYASASKMRASYYFMGALLGRFGYCRVSMPGGCPLGDRPIDQHVKAFQKLSAVYVVDRGMVDITTPNGLKGSQIFFDCVTVGATMNAILASVKAEGMTVIENAAKEPHIVDLASFLNSMGADIMGAGTDTIRIRGTKHLHGTSYAVIPDQIEAGTYMVAAAATGGNVLVKNVIPKHLESIIDVMQSIGVKIEQYDDAVRVYVDGPLVKTNIKTRPHPGFPTDMQPQISALLCLATGTSMIKEGVSDARFQYVEELRRMGADIQVDGKVAVIEGKGKLTGAPVRACDLRAGAALMIAGLAANGTTRIGNIFHIERGYADMVNKLKALGADIHKEAAPIDNNAEADKEKEHAAENAC